MQWSCTGAPVAEAAAAPVAAPPVVEEKTAFDVKLDGFDAAAKIKVIKEIRVITELGLKEAKEMVCTCQLPPSRLSASKFSAFLWLLSHEITILHRTTLAVVICVMDSSRTSYVQLKPMLIQVTSFHPRSWSYFLYSEEENSRKMPLYFVVFPQSLGFEEEL